MGNLVFKCLLCDAILVRKHNKKKFYKRQLEIYNRRSIYYQDERQILCNETFGNRAQSERFMPVSRPSMSNIARSEPARRTVKFQIPDDKIQNASDFETCEQDRLIENLQPDQIKLLRKLSSRYYHRRKALTLSEETNN